MCMLVLTGCSEEKITGFTPVTEPLYDSAKDFKEGFALVSKKDDKGRQKYFFIDTAGNVISKEYDIAHSFSE